MANFGLLFPESPNTDGKEDISVDNSSVGTLKLTDNDVVIAGRNHWGVSQDVAFTNIDAISQRVI
jgi:hypothetical protein